MNPNSPVGVLSDSTADIREQMGQVFAQVVSGASDAPKQPQAAHISTVLYSAHFLVLLFWMNDSTPDGQATGAASSIQPRCAQSGASSIDSATCFTFTGAAGDDCPKCVWWNCIMRTIWNALAYMTLRGMGYGFVLGGFFGAIYGGALANFAAFLYGAVIGAFMGWIAGTASGILNGLVVGILNYTLFRRVANPVSYRKIISLLCGLLAFIGLPINVMIFTGSGNSMTFASLAFLFIPGLIAASAAGYVGWQYAEKSIIQQTKIIE